MSRAEAVRLRIRQNLCLTTPRSLFFTFERCLYTSRCTLFHEWQLTGYTASFHMVGHLTVKNTVPVVERGLSAFRKAEMKWRPAPGRRTPDQKNAVRRPPTGAKRVLT